jgi:DNA-binding MarR family transcriptional regulator
MRVEPEVAERAAAPAPGADAGADAGTDAGTSADPGAGAGGGAAGDAEALLAVVGQLRRGVRGRVGRDWPHPRLPEAQLELLRVVAARPGLRVQDAADELRLAANTVSTMVNGPALAGLVERRRDPRDGRAVLLHPTAAAVERLAAWRGRHRAVVADALAALPGEDRRAIAGALPALHRLVDRLGRSA